MHEWENYLYSNVQRARFCMALLTLCETCFAPSGLTQDRRTTNTQHNCLSMAEHCCDLVAAWKIEQREQMWHRHQPFNRGGCVESAEPSVLKSTGMQRRTWTFHIHKVRVGTLNKTLLLVSPLLLLRGWVQQVFCELSFFKEGTRSEQRC